MHGSIVSMYPSLQTFVQNLLCYNTAVSVSFMVDATFGDTLLWLEARSIYIELDNRQRLQALIYQVACAICPSVSLIKDVRCLSMPGSGAA